MLALKGLICCELLITTVKTEDIAKCDAFQTRIKAVAVWNRILGFHVTYNLASDVMHDLLEGVCVYDMGHIIHYLVNERHFIDNFVVLNARIQGFPFSLDDEGDRIPAIPEFKKPGDFHRMKASEMFCLVHNFALMVGDMVPAGDEVWSFYLCLREILDIAFAKCISKKDLILLKTLISEHHEEYLRLFNDTLKPKHHFMLHYARAIEFLGPLSLIWCTRFESKHGQLKRTAYVICNFKNICKSLAHKHQMKLCYRLQAHSGLSQDDLVVGTGCIEKLSYSLPEEIYDLLTKLGLNNQQQFIANWVACNGIKYRPGQVLVVDVQYDMPKFGTLYSIIVNPLRNVFLLRVKCALLCMMSIIMHLK